VAGVSAVLLAAGESRRMGQIKALLAWEGQPLLRYQVEQLLAAPLERVALVLGYRAEDLRVLVPDDPRITVVVNPDFASGKVSSIVAGVATLDIGEDVLILGVDQPRPSPLIASVVVRHQVSQCVITVAAFSGRRGHPVIFTSKLRHELLEISEESEGLRSLIRRHAADVRAMETGDPIALVNLNTPEDYAAALRLSSTSSARAGNQ